MKKFNLFNEIIISSKESIEKAVESKQIFAINIAGEVIYEPFGDKEILIYRGSLNLDETKSLSNVFGRNYQIVEDNDRVLIKAFSSWQELIGLNTLRASYDDTTADGVGEFADKALEDIGWQVTEFNVKYRALVEVLEESCDGTILCIEQAEPYQFSGLGFLSDDAQAKETLFNWCRSHISNLLESHEDYKIDELEDDQLEALEFFNLNS